MKRITTILAWLMGAPMAMGQALSYTPPPIGVYASADGLTWNALTTGAGYGQLPYTPPAYGAYCQTSSGVPWTPCVFGGGGSGTVNSGTAFAPAYYPGTGTAVSGATPFTGIQCDSTSAAPGACTGAQVASSLNGQTITPTIINAQRYANGAPSTCTTTSGGALTNQADCAFYQAVDASNAASANIDLNFGDGFYNACVPWVEPTGGWFVNLIGASMSGTTIVGACSHPTTPMLSSSAGFPIVFLRNLTFYGNSNVSSCFDLLAGSSAGSIENVTCDNVAATAVSGSDHFLQLGTSSNYAEDLHISNLLIGGAPAFPISLASLTATLTGTSLTGITINSGGSGYSSTYVVGIVNDPHRYCTTLPAFTVTLTSGVVTGKTITSAGNCSAAPDLNVINQYPVTYGAKLYTSDSKIDYFFPSAGITGAIVYGGNNSFSHAHPEVLQYGIVNTQTNRFTDTECDTIYGSCFIFQGTAGTTVTGTVAYTNHSQNMTGTAVYQFATGASDINFGPQANLCSGGTPQDYQEFIGPSGPVIPGGTGWPTGSSISGNDHSCGYIPSTQAINFVPGPGTIVVQPATLSGQTANISSLNTIYTTGPSGYYLLCAQLAVTTAATTSSTLPYTNAIYTNPIDSNTKYSTATQQSSGNATYVGAGGCTTIYAKAATTIGLQTGGYASSGATAMVYTLTYWLVSQNPNGQ